MVVLDNDPDLANRNTLARLRRSAQFNEIVRGHARSCSGAISSPTEVGATVQRSCGGAHGGCISRANRHGLTAATERRKDAHGKLHVVEHTNRGAILVEVHCSDVDIDNHSDDHTPAVPRQCRRLAPLVAACLQCSSSVIAAHAAGAGIRVALPIRLPALHDAEAKVAAGVRNGELERSAVRKRRRDLRAPLGADRARRCAAAVGQLNVHAEFGGEPADIGRSAARTSRCEVLPLSCCVESSHHRLELAQTATTRRGARRGGTLRARRRGARRIGLEPQSERRALGLALRQLSTGRRSARRQGGR